MSRKKKEIEKNLKPFYVVNFSGGKNSTALLIRLKELNYTIDDIIFLKTGMEYPYLENHIKAVENYINQKITILKASNNPKETFLYYMLEKEKITKDGEIKKGLGFPSYINRWCSTKFKRDLTRKYKLEKEKEGYIVKHYKGITYDKKQRAGNDLYPLIDWKWTEKDCLEYCYFKGFNFNNLYHYFDSLSCWCCPLQTLHDLKNLRKLFPNLWEELLEIQQKTKTPFRNKPKNTVQELEKRFKKEEETTNLQKFS